MNLDCFYKGHQRYMDNFNEYDLAEIVVDGYIQSVINKQNELNCGVADIDCSTKWNNFKGKFNFQPFDIHEDIINDEEFRFTTINRSDFKINGYFCPSTTLKNPDDIDSVTRSMNLLGLIKS